MPQGIKNYLSVAKPGIIAGTLISAAAGFFLASRGRFDGALLLATLLGISLVMSGAWSPRTALAGIFIAGILQILVHLHYFLHLDASSAARWNVAALVFTILIMILFVGGTFWIMYTLNYRMM